MRWFRRKTAASGLERPLAVFGDQLPFNVRMATEGVFVCAELGWGKTWLCFMRFLECYLRAMGGFIFGAKGEDLAVVIKLFEKHRARDRLTVIRPGGEHKINWMQGLMSIASEGAVTEEVVGGLTSLLELDRRSASSKGDDTSHYFKTHGMLLLSSIITILRLSGEQITASGIYRFLTSMPVTTADLASESWKEASYANQCMKRAFDGQVGDKSGDYKHARAYLFGELANLNDRTRSSLISTVSAMLSKLLKGWMADLFSTTTTIDLARAYREAHWFYFDISPLVYGEYGTSALVMAKHLVQRIAMRRLIDADSKPFAMMGDEFQNIFVAGGDRDFSAISRQKLVCSWWATQNLSGLYAVLGGDAAAESTVKSWLALQGCKIFGANTDWASNIYPSELCGQTLQHFGNWGVNSSRPDSAYELLMGSGRMTFGMQEQYQPVLRPESWVALRKPVPPKYEAEGIVISSRLVRLIGRHWKKVIFNPPK